MQEEMQSRGIDPSQYGFASVQLDGGIENATAKAHDWFAGVTKLEPAVARVGVSLAKVPIAIIGEASSGGAAKLAASLLRGFVGAGGTAVAPANAAMLHSAA